MNRKKRPEYLVSTDSIGFLGTSGQFIELWQEYFDNETFVGVEAIAFRSLSKLKKLVAVLKENNIKVLSFHGRTGDVRQVFILKRIILFLINSMIVNTSDLLKSFSRDKELLFHSSVTEAQNIEKMIIKNPPIKLWIENNPSGEKEINKTIEQVIEYRKKGINAFGLFDVFHFVRNLSTVELEKKWSVIVGQIEEYFKLKDKSGRQVFLGIHFPIGTRLADSLPIEEMSDQMLVQFAKKIIPQVQRVVFENQQKPLLGLLYSTREMLRDQKMRNNRIISRLKKTGIII